jgi:hypothetical protein
MIHPIVVNLLAFQLINLALMVLINVLKLALVNKWWPTKIPRYQTPLLVGIQLNLFFSPHVVCLSTRKAHMAVDLS